MKSNNNETINLKKCILFFLLAITFAVLVSRVVSLHQMQQQVADKVIRFHVLANSDSDADQALKLAVRDSVGTYLGEHLASAEDVFDGKAIITEHLDEIEAYAKAEIVRQGYDYPVSASLENCYFPIKAYGKAVFPPGNYQALRVVIGEGEGKNWWCVLYPNLCFSGSLYQIDEKASAEKLQTVLSPEEYKMIMENKEYEISFRIQEVISGMFTK
ncbi:MAG: stage II sporulation protein R [Eubacterium sp.]|nr:stage II sporulation protein R [Eubacterium sp.]